MRFNFFGNHRNALGESPLWDGDRQRLWWVDALNGQIQGAEADGTPAVTWRYSQAVGSIALSDSGLVAAMADGFHLIDAGSGEATAIASCGGDGLRLNDGKTDRSGRFFSREMRTRDD